MQAKACKIRAHEWLDCDASLWIDGRIELKNLNQAFQWLRSEMAFQRHHDRNCIYTEAEHCKRVRRGDPRKIDHTIQRYVQANYPPNSGLFYGGIILRKHNGVSERFNREWWREVNDGTSRDQISLPVVLRRLGIRFDVMPYQLPTHSIGNHRR